MRSIVVWLLNRSNRDRRAHSAPNTVLTTSWSSHQWMEGNTLRAGNNYVELKAKDIAPAAAGARSLHRLDKSTFRDAKMDSVEVVST